MKKQEAMKGVRVLFAEAEGAEELRLVVRSYTQISTTLHHLYIVECYRGHSVQNISLHTIDIIN